MKRSGSIREIANLPFYKRYRAAAESLHPNLQNPKFADEAQRGLDAFKRADFDQAIVAFDELIRLDLNHSEAHRWRGDASLNKHEFDKAVRIRRSDPARSEEWHGLQWSWRRLDLEGGIR